MYFLLNMGDFPALHRHSFVNSLEPVTLPFSSSVLHSFHLFPQVTYLATQKVQGPVHKVATNGTLERKVSSQLLSWTPVAIGIGDCSSSHLEKWRKNPSGIRRPPVVFGDKLGAPPEKNDEKSFSINGHFLNLVGLILDKSPNTGNKCLEIDGPQNHICQNSELPRLCWLVTSRMTALSFLSSEDF